MLGEYIKSNWIFAFGFLAQTVFGLRVLVQWWMAEKNGSPVSPTIFWKISLLGSIMFLIYGILRNDFVIILGQFIGYFIYLRNLHLKNEWQKLPLILRTFFVFFPVIIIVSSLSIFSTINVLMMVTENWSILFFIGIVGQLLLNFRFVYQLYYSEQKNESLLPKGFWWISLIGSGLVILYSVYKREPVLLLAQSLALVPYIRNIVLSKKQFS